ncbi:hypothetical protein OKW24_003958 [Peribacillus simplex]|uniref:hypothetical protein n=1 Tax=Peribacillus simplex TaxID=1478 RepID=UPI0024E1BEFC|nr:hypothetical protein [Peribacillus simplex]MDF9762185.1 hypothetical protein [Peribacillus simplex]
MKQTDNNVRFLFVSLSVLLLLSLMLFPVFKVLEIRINVIIFSFMCYSSSKLAVRKLFGNSNIKETFPVDIFHTGVKYGEVADSFI